VLVFFLYNVEETACAAVFRYTVSVGGSHSLTTPYQISWDNHSDLHLRSHENETLTIESGAPGMFSLARHLERTDNIQIIETFEKFVFGNEFRPQVLMADTTLAARNAYERHIS
jgi:hypothetical protein